ncbi:hypothetical protein UABAM_05271 [Candidatus Uabimicrobium amorphum]|uniref:DUF309 domain-containing protein n=1 Tax=Uabimicrobium amorphum TaxID=2596890 RepID=A0A5S9ISS0_UABAM|nr:DUF309 domain-containing protein [Candidatus Uabimicrobium amorphum]BBM86871.1 hypothetical protein UABAM_05271 [Candidatus Uabimicrobium amorphum]
MSNLSICSKMPRLIPERPFSPYRYVNGLNPHPIKDPKGHSYGSQEPTYSLEYLDPDNWQQNKDYLYGIDLYHHFYFWESHEAWEGLWNAYGRETIPGKFMQGLIQNAAAQIKLHKKQLTHKKLFRISLLMCGETRNPFILTLLSGLLPNVNASISSAKNVQAPWNIRSLGIQSSIMML